MGSLNTSHHWLNYFSRSGHQCRSDGAGQDSHCCGLCWGQVYSGHRTHPWIPCKNVEIIFQNLRKMAELILCFTFQFVLQPAKYVLAIIYLNHVGWNMWFGQTFLNHWLYLLLCIFNQETQGVCVATYGPSKDFPAFFSPQSGFTSPYQVRNPEEAATLIGISNFYILNIQEVDI